jgi:hypothetical protein
MYALAERSLVRIEEGGEHFSVHRLIQQVTRYYLKHPPEDESPIEAPQVETQVANPARDGPLQVEVVNQPKPSRWEKASWKAGVAAAVIGIPALVFAALTYFQDSDTTDPAQEPDPAPVSTSATTTTVPEADE